MNINEHDSDNSVMVDYSRFEAIPSVNYRQRIAKLCSNLKALGEVKQLTLFVFLDDGSFTWLSNNPLEAILAHTYRYNIFELRQLIELHSNDGYFFIDSIDFSDHHAAFNQMLQETFAIFGTLGLIRSCQECQLLILLAHEQAVPDKRQYYRAYLNAIEQFCGNFLDKSMDILLEALPVLKPSRFASDSSYRKMILENRQPKVNYQIYRSEIETLYWSAQGKTIDEIALILNFSNHTVATYRQRIINKLNAKNITHAVYLAKKYRLIN